MTTIRRAGAPPRAVAWAMISGAVAMFAGGALLVAGARHEPVAAFLVFAGAITLVVAWMSRFMATLPANAAASAGGGPVPVRIDSLGVTSTIVALSAAFAWGRSPHLALLWAPVIAAAGAVLASRMWKAWMRAIPRPRPARLALHVGLQSAAPLAFASWLGYFGGSALQPASSS